MQVKNFLSLTTRTRRTKHALRAAQATFLSLCALFAAPFAVAAPGQAGTLDTTFGGGGVATNLMNFGNSRAAAVAYNFNYGRVLLAGSCFNFNGSFDDFCLARYFDDGRIDTDFGGGSGVVYTDVGRGYDNATAVYFESGDKAVVAGACANGAAADFCAVRYNFNGTLDTSFGNNGRALIAVGNANDYANAIAKQFDGKFVLAGYCTNGAIDQMCMVRLNENGSLDTTFGNNGRVIENIFQSATERRAHSVAIDRNGAILIAGYCKASGVQSMCALRYDSNGVRDLTFAGGALIFQIGSDSRAASAVVLRDQKILIGGTCKDSPAPANGRTDFCAARFNADGTLDTAYGGRGDGKVISSAAMTVRVNSAVAERNGKFVLAGSCDFGGQQFCAIRYLPNGELDSTFGNSGLLFTSILSSNSADAANAAFIQPDGKLLLAGECDFAGTLQFCAARYEAECTLDLDLSGSVEASADGVILARSMLGFAGRALTNGTNHYSNYVYQYRAYCAKAPAPLCNGDIDGDGKQTATVDGLLAIRAMLGLTFGNALTNGIRFPSNATRTNSQDIGAYLNAQCGMKIPLL